MEQPTKQPGQGGQGRWVNLHASVEPEPDGAYTVTLRDPATDRAEVFPGVAAISAAHALERVLAVMQEVAREEFGPGFYLKRGHVE